MREKGRAANVLGSLAICLGTAFLLAFFSLAAQGAAKLETVQNDPYNITVQLSIDDVGVNKIIAEDGVYHQLMVEDLGVSQEVGKPEVPVKTIFLEIPYGVNPTAKVVNEAWVSKGTGFRVYPHQPPASPSLKLPPFTIDQEYYDSGKSYPSKGFQISEDGFIRGRRVILLKIFPVRFNPRTGEVDYARYMEIRVSMHGKIDAEGEVRKAKLFAPGFNAISKRLIKNYDYANKNLEDLSRPKSGDQIQPLMLLEGEVMCQELTSNDPGADYLIIVADDLVNSVLPLDEWTTLKGYKTLTLPMSKIGTTSADVKDCIQNFYDNLSPKPSYVLLVGDTQHVPPNMLDSFYGEYLFPSDFPYSLVDGEDKFPDLTLGRIAVSSADTCTIVVNKILKYDRHPDMGAWYKKALVTAQWEDDEYQCEDGWDFVSTAAPIVEFFENKLNWDVHKSFVSVFKIDGLPCKPAYYYHYHVLNPFAPETSVAPNFVNDVVFDYDTATTKILEAYNEGMGFVYHVDHGGGDQIVNPPFGYSTVDLLQNGYMTPVVYIDACLTGKFDYDDNFTEYLLEYSGGGAVGTIGASDVMSVMNLIGPAFISALWPDFPMGEINNIYPITHIPAEALNYGRYYEISTHGDWEVDIIHWFGDPAMMIRTATPHHLTTYYSSSSPIIGLTDTEFSVVASLDGARVALVQNGEVLGTAEVSGGIATVPIDLGLAEPGPVHLTITGYNAVPAERVVSRGVTYDGFITWMRNIYPSWHTAAEVVMGDSCFAGEGYLYVDLYVDGSWEQELLLSENPANSGIFKWWVSLDALGVVDGDTLRLEYTDPDDGKGGYDVPKYDVITIDSDDDAPLFDGLKQAVAGDGSIELFWDAATSGSQPIYNIYRGTSHWGQDFNAPIGYTDQLSYKDETATNGTIYYYVVRAMDALGNEDDNFIEKSTRAQETEIIYNFPLDTDPGWTAKYDWEFGQPTGEGSYNGDPTSGYSGNNVYGTNLNGDYSILSYLGDETNLTTNALDLSGYSNVHLSFWRWLGIDNQLAYVEVSNDGASWQEVWTNGGWINDESWNQIDLDISRVADGHDGVYIRWGIKKFFPGAEFELPGWNIDDIQITGVPNNSTSGTLFWEKDYFNLTENAGIRIWDLDVPWGCEVYAWNVTKNGSMIFVGMAENPEDSGRFYGTIDLDDPQGLDADEGDEIGVKYYEYGGQTHYDYAHVRYTDLNFEGLSKISAGDGFVYLSWNPATTAMTPVIYHIYRSETQGNQNFDNPIATTTSLNFIDDNVINCQTYYYVVRAKDASGLEDTNTEELFAMAVPLRTFANAYAAYTTIVGGVISVDATQGEYIYVVTPYRIMSYKLLGPDNFLYVDSAITGWLAKDVFIGGNFAYTVSDRGLTKINISNPQSLDVVTIYDNPHASGVFVLGNYAYVANGPSGLLIFDVSNPNPSAPIGSYATNGYSFGLYVKAVGSDTYAYVADKNGLYVIDVTDPEDPVLAGHSSTAGAAWKVIVNGNYAYVGDGYGVKVFDVTNPANNPTLVSIFDIGGYVYDLVAKNNYLYFGGLRGLFVMDISDPNNPMLVGRGDMAFRGFDISDDYIFCGSNSSLYARKMIEPLSSDGTVAWDKDYYGVSETADIEVKDKDLACPGLQYVDAWSSSTYPDGIQVPITVDPDFPGIFHGSVQLSTDLTVASGDLIEVEYIDADDGQAGQNVAKQDLATVLDSDGDGLDDYTEVALGTDPDDPDSDDDTLLDGEEIYTWDTDPLDADSDDDGLTDAEEVLVWLTDPNDSDSDDDQMPDNWEATYSSCMTPDTYDDPSGDADSDGLLNFQEYQQSTNPCLADEDNDGLNDYQELYTYGTNPHVYDSDGDNLNDYLEVIVYLTNPWAMDSDGDGLIDGPEVTIYGTDPADYDSDDDGMWDGWELWHNFDPLDGSDGAEDADSDDLNNVGEFNAGADPWLADTDYDGMGDKYEADHIACLHPAISDYADDPDEDLLTNIVEHDIYDTNPCEKDTDSDWMDDLFETQHSSCLDALISDSASDPDEDGIMNLLEYALVFTNPCNEDTDYDGLSDGFELGVVVGPGADGDLDTTADPNDVNESGLAIRIGEDMEPNTTAQGDDLQIMAVPATQDRYFFTEPTIADSDDDDMPDGWEESNSECMDPTVDDGTEDPDEDSRTNYQEYITSHDPCAED